MDHLVPQGAGPGERAMRGGFSGRDHAHHPPRTGRHRFQEGQAGHPRLNQAWPDCPCALVEDLHERWLRRLVAELPFESA